MPKQSYAQEVATLEETVAAARSIANVLPPLALTVAGEAERRSPSSRSSRGGSAPMPRSTGRSPRRSGPRSHAGW